MNTGGKDLSKVQSQAMDYETFDKFDLIQMKLFSKGLINEVDPEQIRELLSNPETSLQTLEKLSQYYYISNGEIFQQYDLTRVLPSLNYTISCMKRDSKTEANVLLCKQSLKANNHKELTRDIVSQVLAAGTLVGIWVGKKKNLYPVIFDDLEHFFPSHRRNGKWVVWADLAYFDKLTEFQRQDMLESLTPYISIDDYEKYKADPRGYRYIELPVERTICVRTHTLKRNQRFGMPWITSSLYDISHKKHLQNLEKSVANKVINAVAKLTIGDEANPNLKMNKGIKQGVYSMTKSALEKNATEENISLISLPEWANLEFPEMKSDALEPDKFESINNDVAVSTGVSKSLVGGDGGNYATSKLNMDILYRKICELLEIIEIEVYGKLLNIILPNDVRDNYELSYDKTSPLSTKERADFMMNLHKMGYTLKPLVESIGLNYNEIINDTLYEIEELKLREKVIPPLNTNNISSDDTVGGRPSDDSSGNESTQTTRDNGANDSPRAGV